MAKELEERVIKSIQTGNLEEFKAIEIYSNDIENSISIQNKVEVITKDKSPSLRFITAPTVIILSILCEQPEILKYIINTFHPKFKAHKNGWYPIHFASFTSSYECMQILLKYEFIQKSIDKLIEPPIYSDSPCSTTALHIAVSNHKHAQAILLLNKLPKISFDIDFNIIKNPTESPYKSADPNFKTSSGSTPLHIATIFNDIDMIKILLFYGADTSIPNNNGKTPVEIAKDNEFDEALDILTNNRGESLYSKYIKEQESVEKVEEKQEKEEKRETRKEVEYATKDDVKALNSKLASISSLLEQMKARVEELGKSDNNDEINICPMCGSITKHKCPECGEYHCPECPHVI